MEKKFIITIGRQYGSGGREIGKKLADMLHIGFYDRKLITEAAKRSGLDQEVFEQKDEKLPGSWIHAFSTGIGFIPGFSQESLFKIQSDTIKEIASKESCVIVGRCADYVLRGNPKCFNIFIHSPKDIRIERVILRNNVDKKEAAEIIQKTDKGRAAYYDFYTDKHWGESASYHLSVDSSLLGVDESAQFICDFVMKARDAGR